MKFYCEQCDKHTKAIIEDCKKDELNPEHWGDIVCALCYFVIASYSADRPGKLVFEAKGEIDE